MFSWLVLIFPIFPISFIGLIPPTVGDENVSENTHIISIPDDWMNDELHFRHLFAKERDYRDAIAGLDCGSVKSMILTMHDMMEMHR